MFNQNDYDNFGKTFIPERDAFPVPQIDTHSPATNLVKTFPCAPAYRIRDYETQPMTFQPPRSGGMGTGLTGDVNNIPSLANARWQPEPPRQPEPRQPEPKQKELKFSRMRRPLPFASTPSQQRAYHLGKKHVKELEREVLNDLFFSKKPKAEIQAKIARLEKLKNDALVCGREDIRNLGRRAVEKGAEGVKGSKKLVDIPSKARRGAIKGIADHASKSRKEFDECMERRQKVDTTSSSCSIM